MCICTEEQEKVGEEEEEMKECKGRKGGYWERGAGAHSHTHTHAHAHTCIHTARCCCTLLILVVTDTFFGGGDQDIYL